jgi:transposase-like protein
MHTSDDGGIVRRRRRTHSAEFKAKVVSACRRPGVSMAAVALANGLNANLVRRWVVTEERSQPGTSIEAGKVPVASTVEHGSSFIPIALERSPVVTPPSITIELRRGAMVAKVEWPLAAATECSAWLRELLR